jgi:hypothetical protein
MTLIKLIESWLKEKWPGRFYIEYNIEGCMHVFSRDIPGYFLLKVHESYVYLADHNYRARCVCCSVKLKVAAADPEIFTKIEAEINAFEAQFSRPH